MGKIRRGGYIFVTGKAIIFPGTCTFIVTGCS